MHKKYWLICCLGCLMSCTGAAPKTVLSSRKMRDVLVELELASASLPYRPQQAGGGRLQAARLYAYVFEKNGLKEGDFERSNRYYSAHPQRYAELMQAVVDSLKALKAAAAQRVKAQEKAWKAYERFQQNDMPCVSCKPAYFIFLSP